MQKQVIFLENEHSFNVSRTIARYIDCNLANSKEGFFNRISVRMKFEQALALGPLEGKITFPLFASLSPYWILARYPLFFQSCHWEYR